VGTNPVLEVSKIREVGLPLFEAAGPLRFLSSSLNTRVSAESKV
jgi:hypothetical protein